EHESCCLTDSCPTACRHACPTSSFSSPPPRSRRAAQSWVVTTAGLPPAAWRGHRTSGRLVASVVGRAEQEHGALLLAVPILQALWVPIRPLRSHRRSFVTAAS